MNRRKQRIAFPACCVIIKSYNLDILWDLYSLRSLSIQIKLSAIHNAFL